jgi:hypothetical protein
MPDKKTECEVCLEYLKDGQPPKWHMASGAERPNLNDPEARLARSEFFCAHDACLRPEERTSWEPLERTPEHLEWLLRRLRDPGYKDPGPS